MKTGDQVKIVAEGHELKGNVGEIADVYQDTGEAMFCVSGTLDGASFAWPFRAHELEVLFSDEEIEPILLREASQDGRGNYVFHGKIISQQEAIVRAIESMEAQRGELLDDIAQLKVFLDHVAHLASENKDQTKESERKISMPPALWAAVSYVFTE